MVDVITIVGITIILFIVYLILTLICLQYTQEPIRGPRTPVTYENLRPHLQTGDIILCRALDATKVRKAITVSYYSHVAMVYKDPKTNNIHYIETRAIPKQEFVMDCFQTLIDRPDYELAIRRLLKPLSSEQQEHIRQLILNPTVFNVALSQSQIATRVFKLLKTWMYRELFLQPKMACPSINDSHFLCTDFIAWVLCQTQVLHSSPSVLTPDFFVGPDIHMYCHAPMYHDDIIRIDK
ncbi:MAG: hypothetical protein Sylvanvirus1_26 [Sylvanvirus sp.]|uniref:Uncharacterized protein n=1 Tax=Sylvanvirus sp. TaxID=2487774 RepID=A0A3G5AH17_9VIRU|nr:MAG: hypothetical protein Sylvanvirus1_26 [Sylvanvirus sp.]